MSDTYFTYSNQNQELKYRLRCFFLTKMLAQLNGHCIERKVFAHHNKKSHGQNCYHVVNTPGWKQ